MCNCLWCILNSNKDLKSITVQKKSSVHDISSEKSVHQLKQDWWSHNTSVESRKVAVSWDLPCTKRLVAISYTLLARTIGHCLNSWCKFYSTEKALVEETQRSLCLQLELQRKTWDFGLHSNGPTSHGALVELIIGLVLFILCFVVVWRALFIPGIPLIPCVTYAMLRLFFDDTDCWALPAGGEVSIGSQAERRKMKHKSTHTQASTHTHIKTWSGIHILMDKRTHPCAPRTHAHTYTHTHTHSLTFNEIKSKWIWMVIERRRDGT